MTETTTETETTGKAQPARVEAPADVAEDDAKGYAVYDRTLGQFVGEVTAEKPSSADARKLAPDHTVKVVRV